MTAAKPVPGVTWAIAANLALLSVMSYLDRQVLALLVPDLYRDLGLSDLQIGTLIGPAFILPYLAALVLASLIVDRFNKVAIICCGTAFWGVMTFASAFSRSYEDLLLFRAGLAVGEAMLGPAATALIGTLFADLRPRLTASAMFLMGSTIGASGSAAFAALAFQLVSPMQLALPGIGSAAPWRLTLIAVSLPSLVLAVTLLVLARSEARRGKASAFPAAPGDAAAERLGEHLRSHAHAYLSLSVASYLTIMVQVGTFIWGPAHLMRRFAMTQVDAGYALGLTALFAGVSGTLASTWILRRWAPAASARQFAAVTLALAPAGMACLAAAMQVSSLPLWLALTGVALFILGIVVTIPMQYLQATAPAHLKGRVAVCLYVIIYVFTSGLGPIVPPVVGHLFFSGTGQLGDALALTAVICGTASAGILLSVIPERRFDNKRSDRRKNAPVGP